MANVQVEIDEGEFKFVGENPIHLIAVDHDEYCEHFALCDREHRIDPNGIWTAHQGGLAAVDIEQMCLTCLNTAFRLTFPGIGSERSDGFIVLIKE